MNVVKKPSDLIGTFWKWKSEYSSIDIPAKVFLIIDLDGDYPIYMSHSGRFHESSVSWQRWEVQQDRVRIF